MSKPFERLVDLLGTSMSNPALRLLLNELEEEPNVHDTKYMQTYMFLKHGLYIILDKRQDQIKSLFVHISTVAEEEGNVVSFSEDLPFGISADDNRDAVKEKMGVSRQTQKI